MSIVVLWIDTWLDDDCLLPHNVSEARFKEFKDDQLTKALAFAAEKRKNVSCSHVIISTELAGSVGKPGVDSVENGKTPDGHDYEWSKKHRGNPQR